MDYHRFVRPRLGLAFSRWLDKGGRHPSPRRRAFWRLLAGFVLLLALFGTIVFAVAASGHDPFSFGGRRPTPPSAELERQIGRVAGSIDRLVEATRASTTVSQFQTAAAGGDFSGWTASLGSARNREIANELALAFVKASGNTLGQPAARRLTQIFDKLLTSSGAEASNAAGTLSSLTSLLTAGEQTTLKQAIDGVLSGATRELGTKAVDGLIGLFDTLGAGKKSVLLTSTVAVSVSLRNAEQPPTSFLWFNRTWGRDDRKPFEGEFQAKHSYEKKRIRNHELKTLYECHRAVLKVLGVAAPRRNAARLC